MIIIVCVCVCMSQVHKCAVKVSRTLFEFHVTSLEDSFIKQVCVQELLCSLLYFPFSLSLSPLLPLSLYQVSDMFDLKDDHVPGYDPPTVITELHSSLLNSAIQYRYTI